MCAVGRNGSAGAGQSGFTFAQRCFFETTRSFWRDRKDSGSSVLQCGQMQMARGQFTVRTPNHKRNRGRKRSGKIGPCCGVRRPSLDVRINFIEVASGGTPSTRKGGYNNAGGAPKMSPRIRSARCEVCYASRRLIYLKARMSSTAILGVEHKET